MKNSTIINPKQIKMTENNIIYHSHDLGDSKNAWLIENEDKTCDGCNIYWD